MLEDSFMYIENDPKYINRIVSETWWYNVSFIVIHWPTMLMYLNSLPISGSFPFMIQLNRTFSGDIKRFSSWWFSRFKNTKWSLSHQDIKLYGASWYEKAILKLFDKRSNEQNKTKSRKIQLPPYVMYLQTAVKLHGSLRHLAKLPFFSSRTVT